MPDNYSEEDLREILAIAMTQKRETDFSRSQLLEIAEELGISTTELQRAEQQWHSQQTKQLNHQNFQRDKHQKVLKSSAVYVITSIFLIFLNLLTSQTIDWSLFFILVGGFVFALMTLRAL